MMETKRISKYRMSQICHLEKGKQIDTGLLDNNNPYAYINGGIEPSGYYTEYNTGGNTITVSEGGVSCGYVNYVTEPFWCGCHCYRLTDFQMNPKYIYYALKANQARIMRLRTGSAMPNIKKSAFESFELALTDDKDAQDQIVHTFDSLTLLIQKRNEQLSKLDNLIKARFVEMFGDPKTNPKNYSIHQLSEYIDFLTSGSRGWAQYCADDGPEWFITIKNVKDCRISVDNMQPVNAPDNAEAKRTKVQEGDLLISITADLGRTGVVTKAIAEHGAYINQHLTCIRLNKEVLNPLYVAYFMESPAGKEQFESKNQSAVKAGLNFNSINSLRLMVPPMDKQNAFVEFVKQVDKSKVVDSIHRMNVLFNITLNGGNPL